MCGRFTITHPNEALTALFDAVPGNDLPVGPNFNVCPTNTVAVVTSDTGARRLRAMRWGRQAPPTCSAPTISGAMSGR